ncbi:unnamed protein product [Timema podura]|uniref:ACT domain-containing protein n=1 Tax=Timema podura TaxID=61482 RepID=A0ABN7P2C2_TIMPD|nr:unnamed protein product [Timema podura]
MAISRTSSPITDVRVENSTRLITVPIPFAGCAGVEFSSQVVVKEEWIAIAILRLVELEKCVVEGAGAAGLAAILAGHLDEMKGKRDEDGSSLERECLAVDGRLLKFTVTVSDRPGGIAELCRLLSSLGVSIKDIMHEPVDGRLLKFTVTVSDRPGGIAELCRLLSSLGVSIKDIMHERAWIQSDIFSVKVIGGAWAVGIQISVV